MSASEPDMEHYLRQAGWVQAEYYPQNWRDVPRGGPDTMIVCRLRAAVQLQIQRDKDAVAAIRTRLGIVDEAP